MQRREFLSAAAAMSAALVPVVATPAALAPPVPPTPLSVVPVPDYREILDTAAEYDSSYNLEFSFGLPCCPPLDLRSPVERARDVLQSAIDSMLTEETWRNLNGQMLADLLGVPVVTSPYWADLSLGTFFIQLPQHPAAAVAELRHQLKRLAVQVMSDSVVGSVGLAATMWENSPRGEWTYFPSAVMLRATTHAATGEQLLARLHLDESCIARPVWS